MPKHASDISFFWNSGLNQITVLITYLRTRHTMGKIGIQWWFKMHHFPANVYHNDNCCWNIRLKIQNDVGVFSMLWEREREKITFQLSKLPFKMLARCKSAVPNYPFFQCIFEAGKVKVLNGMPPLHDLFPNLFAYVGKLQCLVPNHLIMVGHHEGPLPNFISYTIYVVDPN